MHEHFIMFARYNAWANQKLYEAVAELSASDYNKDCQVAFTSMNGTLNHLLIGDLIWLSRFQGTTGAPTGLDKLLHQDFADIWDARKKTDADIVEYIEGLNEGILTSDFSFTALTMPEKVTQQLSYALAHFFNHQTHHRGQTHAMLTRLAGEAPSLDLGYYQREVRLGLIG